MKIIFAILTALIFSSSAFAYSTLVVPGIFEPSSHPILEAQTSQGILRLSVAVNGIVMIKMANGEDPQKLITQLNDPESDAVIACSKFTKMQGHDGVCDQYKIIQPEERKEKFKCDVMPYRTTWRFAKSQTKFPVSLKNGKEFATALLKATDPKLGLFKTFDGAQIIPNTDICGGAPACVIPAELVQGQRRIYVNLDDMENDVHLAQVLVHETVHLAGVFDECKAEQIAITVSNATATKHTTSGYSNTCPVILDGVLTDRPRVEASTGVHCVLSELIK